MKHLQLHSSPSPITRLTRLCVVALAALYAGQYGCAQDIPLISGGVGFFTNTNGGSTVYEPYVKPVLAAPLGNHLLVETRASVVDSFSPKSGGGYKRS